MKNLLPILCITGFLVSACQVSTAPTVDSAICEITEEDVEAYRSLSGDEQRTKYENCELSALETLNAAFTPGTVDLINKQVGFELGLLGYNQRLLEDPVLTENIKGFQRSLGEPESGRLTQKQLIKASKLAQKKSYFAVRLPLSGNGYGPYIRNNPEKLEFQGTWQINEQPQDGPYEFSDSQFNFWEFVCEKKSKKCSSIYVNLGVTDELVGIGQGFERKSYNILSWDTERVVLRDDSFTEKSCRTSTITVDLVKGEVEEKVVQQNTCRRYADLDAPQISNLVSSWQRAKQLNAYRLEQTLNAYTEAYMELKSAR